MAVSTSSASELTQEQVQHLLVKPLEQQSTFLSAGPRIFDTDGSPVRVPKLGSATTTAFYGENEQITDEDVGFDEITLLPSTIKSVKTLTRYSNELARQSVVSLDAAIRQRLVKDVADAIDTAFIASDGNKNGSGDRTEPEGMVNYAGQDVDASSKTIDLDKVLDAWSKLLTANVDPASAVWFMRPETFVDLRKVKTTGSSNEYVLTPDVTRDGVFRLFGSRVIITDRLDVASGTPDTTDAILADMSQVAVARDHSPSVKLLDQTFGDYDQQAIRVTARFDAQPLNDDAVVRVKNIKVA